MSDQSDQPPKTDKPELFDVRDLVANDPDLPGGILPSRKRSASAQRQRNAPKPTRSSSGKAPVYMFVIYGIIGALIGIPAAIFLFIRYVLPPFR